MNKQYKSVIVKRKDVLYDVNFISWKTAKCRIAEAEARAEAQTDDEGRIWFERMLATAVDHLKAKLRWCIDEYTGTIVDNSIKQRTVTYGEEDYPEVEQDYDSFSDDATALDSPAEIKLPDSGMLPGRADPGDGSEMAHKRTGAGVLRAPVRVFFEKRKERDLHKGFALSHTYDFLRSLQIP